MALGDSYITTHSIYNHQSNVLALVIVCTALISGRSKPILMNSSFFLLFCSFVVYHKLFCNGL